MNEFLKLEEDTVGNKSLRRTKKEKRSKHVDWGISFKRQATTHRVNFIWKKKLHDREKKEATIKTDSFVDTSMQQQQQKKYQHSYNVIIFQIKYTY